MTWVKHVIDHVPVPERMEPLPRDHRGYPVPYNVWRDADGKPHFTINDSEKVEKILTENRCPICGKENDPLVWFVGGPLSAFAQGGAYIDQPGHEECIKYALKVCPYLAAPLYSKRLDAKTVDPEKVVNHAIFIDPTSIEARPKFFVAVCTTGYVFGGGQAGLPTLIPIKPYVKVEFWLEGERITKKHALFLIEASKEAHAK